MMFMCDMIGSWFVLGDSSSDFYDNAVGTKAWFEHDTIFLHWILLHNSTRSASEVDVVWWFLDRF